MRLRNYDIMIATGIKKNCRKVDKKSYWKTSTVLPILVTVI